MSRRLGPEETKYWLLGLDRPFNIVLALGMEGWRPPPGLALPLAAVGADGLPRWIGPMGDGLILAQRGPWIEVAEAALAQPLGRAGTAPWQLSVVEEGGGTVLLLAFSHALADARGGLALLARLLEGQPLPPQPPAFEELLSPEAYPAPAMADEVLAWWSRRLSDRLRSLDPARLAGLLPQPPATRLQLTALEAPLFHLLRQRCRREATTLHGAVVTALVEAGGHSRLGHAVDMRRFLPAPFAAETWFGLSHLTTAAPEPGQFWVRARHARALLQQGLAAGLAGAALAELPRTLGAAAVRAISTPPLTVSNNGRLPLPAGPHGRATWFMALAGANAGAPVLTVDGSGEALMLVAAVPENGPSLPLDEIAGRLAAAVSA
jgi:hypothetical protein